MYMGKWKREYGTECLIVVNPPVAFFTPSIHCKKRNICIYQTDFKSSDDEILTRSRGCICIDGNMETAFSRQKKL